MSRIREKLSLSQGKTMHTVEEAQRILRSVPRSVEEPKGRWLERAGRVCSVSRAARPRRSSMARSRTFGPRVSTPCAPFNRN